MSGSHGGCGCGGGATAVVGTGGCGCGCDGTCGCEVSLTGEGFNRPKFFGGMLLTEDDLQAAVDYAAAKRRLTNRMVIGAGVVCGLDVTCHPCDSGKVQVGPGYAIECCGNDILVSCPEEVDVLALVRDLRVRQGVDCGEPCEDQPYEEYYLYVRYAEQPTAPVVPYAADDCATGDCEFSRVREGYCFELRCEGTDPLPMLLDALERCRPRDEEAQQEVREVANVVRLASTYDRAVASLAEGQEPVPPVPTKAEFDAVESGEVKLEEGVELLKRANVVLALDAAGAGREKTAPLRLNAQSRKLIARRAPQVAARLRASSRLEEQPPEERARIEAVLSIAEEQPDMSTLGPMDRVWLAEGMAPAEAERAYVSKAEAVRGRMMQRMAVRGQSSCAEYRKLAGMRIQGLSTASRDEAAVLARSYLDSLADCICPAFNPPCPTCTDDAVALAKLRVDGCDVTHVCALERQWVVSPRAISYWFPAVEAVRRMLERMCCPEATDAPEAPAEPNYDRRQRVEREAMQQSARVMRAASTVRTALGDGPEVQPLMEALGQPAGESPVSIVSMARTFASRAAGAEGEPSVGALAGRIDELEKRLAELSAEREEPK